MDAPDRVVRLSEVQLWYVDALVATGLYGSTREEVLLHLILRGLQAACEKNLIDMCMPKPTTGGFQPQLPLDKPF